MTRADGPESRRLAALIGLVRGATEPPSAGDLDRGLATLRAHLATGHARTRVSVRKTLCAAAILACVVSGVVLVLRHTGRSSVFEQPVTVTRVEGGKILEGGYLAEIGHSGVRLHFNEGSTFVLTSGTRGRLRGVTADGARLALDHGTASFQITRSLHHHWQVEAGPFLVSVRGTDFTVVWEPTSEQLEVSVRQGRVTVSGPVVGEELGLRPGQDLTVNLSKAVTVITEARPEHAPEPSASRALPLPSASVSTAVAVSSLGSTPPAGPSSGRAGAGNERRWQEALANGQWDRILADVERDGVESSLRTLSSDGLLALADAARYRRRPELARAALLTQRERFPNSPRALDALFLLGRVEELRADGRTRAIKWYDAYLARGPGGTYAAEALGRKMILMQGTEGPESARRVAAEYLARFPGGSYAEAARALGRGP